MSSLAEVMTRADGKGAVASWSPTGEGVASGHDYLNRGFFQAVFQDDLRTLGQATMAGKLKLWATGANLYLLNTYLLLVTRPRPWLCRTAARPRNRSLTCRLA